MDLQGFFLGFGFLQGLILCAILLYNWRKNSPSNLLMAGLIAAIALRLGDLWLVRTGYFVEYPALALIASSFVYLWGPLLYLYAKALTHDQRRLRYWPHFIAFFCFCVPPISHMLSNTEQQLAVIDFLWNNPGGSRAELPPILAQDAPYIWRVYLRYHLHGLFFALQFGVYCVLVLRLIKNHNDNLKQHYSSLEKINLRWLTRLTAICIAFLLLYLLLNRSRILTVGHVDITAMWALGPFLFMVVGVYLIGFMALQQPNILGVVQAAKDSPKVPEPSLKVSSAEASKEEGAPQKYKRSVLSDDDAREYTDRLMKVMLEEKLYLDSELTMPDLAKQASLAPYQVSQTLNGPMQQSFFAFVNYYRIELAKEMLIAPETAKMAIVELAVEVGFKSKSSFYDAFKRTTKMTPTQYKKEFSAQS